MASSFGYLYLMMRPMQQLKTSSYLCLLYVRTFLLQFEVGLLHYILELFLFLLLHLLEGYIMVHLYYQDLKKESSLLPLYIHFHNDEQDLLLSLFEQYFRCFAVCYLWFAGQKAPLHVNVLKQWKLAIVQKKAFGQLAIQKIQFPMHKYLDRKSVV